MLHISDEHIDGEIKESDFAAFQVVSNPYKAKAFAYWLLGALGAFIVILFMPWTQYVKMDGVVTSLKPGQRHQTIHATIPGRIDKWYILEGQAVSKGDTIIELSEINAEFMNPKRLERIDEQIQAKTNSVSAYESKVNILKSQRGLLLNKMGVVLDSGETTGDYLANNERSVLKLSKSQLDELIGIEGDIATSTSSMYDLEEELASLKNEYESHKIRHSHQFITAPQDGYITKAQISGIGETVQEGDAIISIMPKHHQLAAELYVDPVDLPLIGLHHKVRLEFDGWPSVVMTGWPDVSYGSFSGEIVAVDNMISENGKYRILICPDNDPTTGGQWPAFLRLGSGVKGMALLNDVPVWKELWRKLNGFPPEWYDDSKYHPYIHDKMKSE